MTTKATVLRTTATAAVWVMVVCLALALSVVRYRAAMTAGQPDFDGAFLPAARAVAAGQSPYSVAGYFYPPLVAVLLAPVSHVGWVMGAWTAVRVTAACAAAFVAVVAFTPRTTWLMRGVFAGAAVVTLLYSWPATLELWAGQPNFLVLLTMALAALAVERRRGVLTGFALGLAAVVKGWPALFAVWLLRVRAVQRLRGWIGLALAAVLAVVMALLVGGAVAVVDMTLAPLRGSDQQLLAANSVWGIGRMLFSRTSVGEPLLVSRPLEIAVTASLAVIVVALLVVTLLRPGPDTLSLFNVAFAVVLLLPVSHLFYLLIVLPVLWWWGIRALQRPRSWTAWLVVAVLVVWWIVCFRLNPAGDGFMTTTWESLSRIFASSLVACGASVIGAAVLDRRATDHDSMRRAPNTSAAAVRSPRA